MGLDNTGDVIQAISSLYLNEDKKAKNPPGRGCLFLQEKINFYY